MRASLLIVALLACGTAAWAQEPASVGDWRRAAEKAQGDLLTDPQRALHVAGALPRSIPTSVNGRTRAEMNATAFWLVGEALSQLDRVTEARVHIDRARASLTPPLQKSQIAARILLSSAGLSSAQSDVARALQESQAAFQLYRAIGDNRGQAVALVCLADLYANGNDYRSALRYLRQALDLKPSDPKLLLSIYNNLGLYNVAVDDHDKAITRLTEALRLARFLGSQGLEAQIHRNFLRAYLANGQMAAAAVSARRAVDAASRADQANDPDLLAALAQLALQQGRPREATVLLDRAFAGADLETTPLPARDAHRTAYHAFQAVGNAPRALAHLIAVKRLDDEATRLATQTNTALMGARFDFANQELRIARLRAEQLRRTVRFEQDRARAQRNLFGIGIAAAGMVVFLLTFALVTLRRSRNAVQAANAELEVTNGALNKALAAKTEFLATTSHEIRTPLNGILGMTQVMLADAKLADEVRDRVRLVHGAGTTMRALVDDILDTAKIEKGELTLEHAPFDLRQVLADAARLWGDQIRAKGVAFDIAIDLPAGEVVGDAARVRQIVFNLLSNAAKFTQAGAISLRATCDGEGRHVVSVVDTGVGIPADKLQVVFESFRQADASTTRRFGGTGLGLSISRNLARAMGGELSVASEEGAGSTFTLCLTLPKSEERTTCAEPSIGAEAVIVADRNPIARAMFRNLLSGQADAIVAAASFAELMAALERDAVRAVLVDESVLTLDAPADAWDRLRERAGDATPVTVLRRAGSDVAAPGARFVDKPIAGPALLATLFSHSPGTEHISALVSRAA